MGITMAADFMAVCINGADQLRPPFRYPAQNEESTSHAGFGKSIEHTARAIADTQREIIPLPARDAMVKSRDMEVILNINCQRIEQRLHWTGRGSLSLPTESQGCCHVHSSSSSSLGNPLVLRTGWCRRRSSQQLPPHACTCP